MIHVVTWHWGSAYGPEYIRRLRDGAARNLRQEHNFIVAHPWEDDHHLTEIPGCMARLRTFDPAWQRAHSIAEGERIVVLDLDLIVTGGLDHVFDRPEPFAILQDVHTANPCPYNGSLWMLRAGYRPDVWSEFSVDAARQVPFFIFPEDQAWLAAKLPGAARFGSQHGVYAFKKPSWPAGDDLPKGARIVAFPGARDPSHFTHLDWVRRHWC
jgi:hypothetical protein